MLLHNGALRQRIGAVEATKQLAEAHLTRACTWQSGLLFCAGPLVTRARNSRAERACPE